MEVCEVEDRMLSSLEIKAAELDSEDEEDQDEEEEDEEEEEEVEMLCDRAERILETRPEEEPEEEEDEVLECSLTRDLMS